jgi:hypothetical protein
MPDQYEDYKRIYLKTDRGVRDSIDTLKANAVLVDILSDGRLRGLAEDIFANACEIEEAIRGE